VSFSTPEPLFSTPEPPRSTPQPPSCLSSDDDEPTWSSWGAATHGPQPRPDWVITALGAIDTELGVLKGGKEADVHLVERAVPGGPCVQMAAKRYRSSEHRMFHRDAGYVEGRRVRRSRENRAMARRTDFGRELLAGQWAGAEFGALSRLWQLMADGAPLVVPYPVQLAGTEVMLEFVGEPDGTAAPRLAQLRPDGHQLRALWGQTVDALEVLAGQGLGHGDLSPYNVLVHRDRLVLIDLPQVVDLVANPKGPEFLERDVAVMARWFAARGIPEDELRADLLLEDLQYQAGLR
jgi:RIO kinase 1